MKNKQIVKLLVFYNLLFSLTFNQSIAQINSQSEIDSLTRLFETTDSIEVKKKILNSLSIQHRNSGDWEKHDQVIQKMFNLQEKTADSSYLSDIYNRLGISMSLRGNNEESLNYFQKSMDIDKAMNHMFGVSASYENMGEIYIEMGDLQSAVDCLLKSLQIKKENNYSRIFNIYIKLAKLHQMLKTDKVEYYIELASQEFQKIDSIMPRDQVVFFYQLSTIYFEREMYDSSFVYNRKVISLSKKINWQDGIAAGIGQQAEVFYKKGKLDSSIVYHQYALKISEEISNYESISDEYLYIAKLFQELGKIDSVLYYADKSLQLADEFNFLPGQSKALKFLADFYTTQNNFEKAYDILQRHFAVEDSISSASVKNNIAEMEEKYQSKMKEQQISLLTAENEIKNQHLKVSVLILVALSILLIFILYIFYSRRRQAKFKEINLRQQLFRSQMNPHFIFNALGSIQNYLYKNKPDLTASYLSKFSFLMRSILNNSTKESISLEEEIEMLKSYVELEQMRKKNAFEYKLIYNENLETEFIKIPPMMVQPFVENAIKHGLKETSENGKLTITFEDKTDKLRVCIEDNGIGINQSMKKEKSAHESKALSIFMERMQTLRKYFKNISIPKISDMSTTGKNGTRVEIELPILK